MTSIPTTIKKIKTNKEIEYFVFSGGGPSLIQSLGIIQELETHSFYDFKNIKAIYGTSSGAVLAVFLCIHHNLHYDWETIQDFFIHRPWNDVFHININTVMNAYSNCGIYSKDIMKKCFHSFFDARNLSLDITLKEFYDTVAQIDLHFFTFELHSFILEDISWKTHPDLPLFTALYMTCAIPLLFPPVLLSDEKEENEKENKCYIDGGIINNYPLKYCIAHIGEERKDSIFGIYNKMNLKNYNKDNNTCNDNTSSTKITKTSTLFDYLLLFILNIMEYMREKNTTSILYQIVSNNNFLTMDCIQKSICSVDKRKELFDEGKILAQQMLSSIFIDDANHDNINT